VDSSRRLYNTQGWGSPYFTINEAGNLAVRPLGVASTPTAGGRGARRAEVPPATARRLPCIRPPIELAAAGPRAAPRAPLRARPATRRPAMRRPPARPPARTARH
jgi:hypothetical protein